MSESSALAVDGPSHPFHDKLLDKLVGNWKVKIKMGKEDAEQLCDVDWVLNHQFLRVHFIDAKTGELRKHGRKAQAAEYEATVFIGYDNMSERYVMHWLDNFGGRFSETLGYGTRTDTDAIRFVFEGGTGPLHNTFTWNSAKGTWSMLIVQKNEKGVWTEFARQSLQRIK